MPGAPVLETHRLSLRPATTADAAFLCRLMNEPAWRANIGNHDVHSPGDAATYIEQRYLPAYADGLGARVACLTGNAEPIGICGLFQRPWLRCPDLGFALLADYRGGGYAFEAASAVLEHLRQRPRAGPVAAITLPGNQASIGLLEKLGFTCTGQLRYTRGSEVVSVYRFDGYPRDP